MTVSTAVFESSYGSANQPITITLNSLTNSTITARASAVVSNTVDKYLDVLVQLQIKSGAAGVSTTGFVNVYGYATADDGTTYSEGLTGTDTTCTLTNPTNLKLIGSINVVATATTYKSDPMPVGPVRGGILPAKWGIVVQNQSGTTFDTVGASFSVFFQGVKQAGTITS